MRATVGGALSQNSVFWGGVSYGCSNESLIGMDVVLANGTLLPTGVHAKNMGIPFIRYDGTDLSGLFVGDCGALGIKTRASLRLVTIPEHVDYLSFSFKHHTELYATISEISRRGLACECYAFDPDLQNSRVLGGETGLVEDIKTLARVADKSGIKESLKVVTSGRRYNKEVQWGLHVNVEDRYTADLEHVLTSIRQISKKNNGIEIPNLPKIVGAYPFPPTNSMVGPDGERWVPIHGKVAHSQAVETIEKIQALYEQQQSNIDTYKIRTGFLLCAVGNTTILIEPVYFWPGELNEVHKRNVESHVLKKFKATASQPETDRYVDTLRNHVRDIFLKQSAVHFQIGKYYPYKDSRQAEAWQLLCDIKKLLDKNNNLNPGQLGLD